MAASIRERQIATLKRMLNFNQQPTKTSASEPQWKVLVYDTCGQDIISPLLSVKELRDMGVTLHLLLHSDREAIVDVPAIYFVMPTDENIKRMAKDMSDQLYESYYFNFISAVSRHKLEDLAQAAIQADAVTQVVKVYDQYVNFISLENDMFVLRPKDKEQVSFYEINRGDVKDTDMDNIMNTIVDGLFSFFVTLGAVPIIRSPRGNAAEMVAEKLDKKIRDNLRDARNSLFSVGGDVLQPGALNFQRPLLLLLDRSMDLATPLHHTWTYQALCHDVLNLALNRVEIDDSSEGAAAAGGGAQAGDSVGGKKKKKSYELNANDKLWVQHRGSPFPTVAEAIQNELDSYRSQEEEVKRLKHAMGLDGEEDAAAIGLLADNTAKLTSAVSSLPELIERKRFIDMHTNIATALLDFIKARKLDLYFETEEKLMSKSGLDKSLIDIIQDHEAGLAEDKLRLFIIALICGPNMTDAEIDQYSTHLLAAGCPMEPLQYARRWRTYAKMSNISNQYGGGGTSTVSMFSKLVSHASQFAMEGVKNLVVKTHKLPATRVVDALMEQKSLPEVENYRYFDPKLLRSGDSSVPRMKTPHTDAVVFMVGGGNYIEYQNLVDYAKDSKRIIYGCSQLLSASQFVQQLSLLGKQIQ